MDKPKRKKHRRPPQAGSSQSPVQASSSGDYSPITQTGDHSPVTQTFTRNQYFDKAGLDWNERLVPASDLKLESFKLGDPTAATFPYVITPVFDTVCQVLRDASDETSKARRGLLLLGEANSGKTRLALEALRATLSDWPVLYWKSVSTRDDIPPVEFLEGKHLILFIDDLQDYLSNISAATVDALVATLTQAAQLVVLVVTCRIENQEQAQKDLSWLFDRLSNIPLPRFPTDIYAPETRQIIDEFERHGPIQVNDWDGTLGSLVLGLSKKHNQYLNLPPSARTVLQAMKLLQLAGVRAHTEQYLRAACVQVFEVDDKALWQEAVHLLTQMLFVMVEMDEERWEAILVIRKDAYFEQVVTDYPEPSQPQLLIRDLVRLREVFKDLKDREALFSLSTLFERLKLPKEELKTIDEIIALDPNRLWGWMLKGIALDRLQRHEEAVAAFNHALDIDKDDAFIWMKKGISLASLQRHKEALVAFERSLEIEPGNRRDENGLWIGNRAWYYKGISLSLLKQYKEALVAFEHDRRHHRPWNVNDIEYVFFAEYCTFRLSSQENQRPYGGTMNLLSMYENGPFLRDERIQKECKKLLACIDQVLVLDAGDVQLWCLKGIVHYLMEQYEKAIAAFNGALTHQSNFLDAWYLKGISLCMLRRHEEALDAFDRGWPHGGNWQRSNIRVHLFSFFDSYWATYLKGAVIEKVKGREQALVAFEYVIDEFFMGYYRQLSPHPYLVSNDGTFKSVSDQEQQKPDEGVAARDDGIVTSIDRIVALYPDNVQLWYYKGVMLYLMERYENALVAFDRTLELDPHFVDAWRSKGYSFKVLGRSEEMVEAFRHAPDDTLQRFEEYSLSVWQRYLGAFDRTRTLYPDNERVEWVTLYQSVRDGHILDPQIIREIGLRFESLANDVETAAKVDFDPVRASQNLYKQADLLESLDEAAS